MPCMEIAGMSDQGIFLSVLAKTQFVQNAKTQFENAKTQFEKEKARSFTTVINFKEPKFVKLNVNCWKF